MKPKLDCNLIFFLLFNDVIILATFMITNTILVFFILEQAYFENVMKYICDPKGV